VRTKGQAAVWQQKGCCEEEIIKGRLLKAWGSFREKCEGGTAMSQFPLTEFFSAAINVHWLLQLQAHGNVRLSSLAVSLLGFLALALAAYTLLRVGVRIAQLWRFITRRSTKAAPLQSQTSSRPGCSCSEGISQRRCPRCGCGGDQGIPQRETLGTQGRQSFTSACRSDAPAYRRPENKLLPAQASQ
jgi:hypothetical protein